MLLAAPTKTIEMNKYTWLWDADLVSFSPSATHQTYQGHQGEQPNEIVRIPDLVSYSPSATHRTRSSRWPSTLDCGIQILSHSNRMLLAGPTKIIKVNNQTKLWDARSCLILAECNSPDKVIRADNQHWIVGYISCLILTECYSPDLPRSSRFTTKLDCKDTRSCLILAECNSPDKVIKVTINTRLWDTHLVSFSPNATRRTYEGHQREQPN